MKFSEAQRAPRVMHWIMLGAGGFSLSIVLVTAILLAVNGEASFNLNDFLIPGGIQVVIFGSMWIVMSRSTLYMSIDDVGVHVRFTPFHRKPRSFAWTDIERIIVRKVNPFGEFGGWGIRSNFGKVTGYVWRGKTGIDLRMRDGRQIVVTIEDIAAAANAIKAAVPTGVEYEQRIADLHG
jgi:hypothetical protein